MKDASRWLAVCIVGLAAAGSTSAHAQDAAARAEAEYAAGRSRRRAGLVRSPCRCRRQRRGGDGRTMLSGGTVYGPAVARDRERARGFCSRPPETGGRRLSFLVEHEAAPVTGSEGVRARPGRLLTRLRPRARHAQTTPAAASAAALGQIPGGCTGTDGCGQAAYRTAGRRS